MSEYKLVTSKEFKEIANNTTGPIDGVAVIRAQPFEIKAEEDSGLIKTFSISTPDIDREGDRITAEGWELDNFQKGGSVLWAHDRHKEPVAKPLATWIENGKLKSKAEFTPKDMNPFGYMVYQMVDGGFLRSASVGFIPKRWEYVEDRGGFMPTDFLEKELLEWSVVPVPSNPQALVDAKALGIDVSPIKSWAEQILDGETIDPIVSKEVAEQAHKEAGPKPVTVDLAAKEESLTPGVNEIAEVKEQISQINIGLANVIELVKTLKPAPQADENDQELDQDQIKDLVKQAIKNAIASNVRLLVGQID